MEPGSCYRSFASSLTLITALNPKTQACPGLMGRIENPNMGARLDAGRKAGVCIFGW